MRSLEKLLDVENEADTRREYLSRRIDSPAPFGLGYLILLKSLTSVSVENQLAWASLTGSCVLRPKALIQIVLMGDR